MRRHPLALLTLAVATLGFGIAIATRHRFDPWHANLIAGVVGTTLSIVVLRDHLRALLAVHGPSALKAAAVGVAMVVATHVGYRVLATLIPSMQGLIEAHYADIEATSPPLLLRILLILFIVLAEELVWRGVAFALLPSQLPRGRVILATTMLYALPQVIGGSWLLLCAALAVGSVFGLQRAHSGRLTEVLITHGIWSVALFALVPLV